jgi:hypothetical protein
MEVSLMIRKFTITSAAVFGSIGFFGGCAANAADETGDTPDVADGTLETRQVITSVNADGTWTADATGTSGDPDNLYASATFTGPAGKTRRMGSCLLKKYQNASSTPTACTTVADCNSAPSSLPTGGFRYCTNPNGSGTKYCYYRPGTAVSKCVGTPANGGTPIAPGTYQTPGWHGTGTFLSYACFEGCVATDPSASSNDKLVVPPCKYPTKSGDCEK